MQGISRRSFLRAGLLGAAVAPFGTGRVALAAVPTNLFARSRFTPLLNASFKMVGTTGTWAVTLAAIADLEPVVTAGDNDRFRLTFRTSARGPSEGVYSFRRAGFTSTSMFVVPDSTGRSYQAIINRR